MYFGYRHNEIPRDRRGQWGSQPESWCGAPNRKREGERQPRYVLQKIVRDRAGCILHVSQFSWLTGLNPISWASDNKSMFVGLKVSLTITRRNEGGG